VSVASPQEGNSIYVGFDVGEWGGGLQQVDLNAGVVTNIERRDTKNPCDGPLNRECDPVTGVIPDPQNRECVLASVGLVHLGISNGRILRVCGSQVTLVSEILLPGGKRDDSKLGNWGRTEAFTASHPQRKAGSGQSLTVLFIISTQRVIRRRNMRFQNSNPFPASISAGPCRG